MKTPFICVLIFCTGFSLFAQTTTRNIPVYVPRVTGNGIDSRDNAYITGLIVREVSGGFTVIQTRLGARYVFIGTLIPYGMYFSYNEDSAFHIEEEDLDPSQGTHVLHLVLQDNFSGSILAEQDLIYSTLEDVEEFFPFLIMRLLSSFFTWAIPTDGKEDYDDWRDKRLYFGVYALWTPRLYTGDTQSFHGANFGFGVSAELHFQNNLAVDMGLAMAPDWVTVEQRGVNSLVLRESYQDLILEIPISLLYTIKPAGAPLLLEPYAGIHFNIPLYGIARAFPMSWRVGFQGGTKAGPGIAYADIRFSMDMGKSEVTHGNAPEPYNRYLFYLAVGYKYGITPSANF